MTLPGAFSIFHRNFLNSHVAVLGPKEAYTLKTSDTIGLALEIFQVRKIGSVLLIDEKGGLAGIFTERDVIAKLALSKKTTFDSKLKDIMSHPVESIKANASVARVLHQMSAGGYRHVPVVGLKGEAPKIVSIRDVLFYIYDRLARKVLESEPLLLAPGVKVDQFFGSDVSVMKAHEPVCVSPNESVASVVRLMIRNKIGSVLITDQSEEVIGIFTERDFITKMIPSLATLESTPISSAMVEQPTTIMPRSSVAFALQLMSEGKYRHLPVVDPLEKIVGIISVKSFINYLSECILTDLANSKKA